MWVERWAAAPLAGERPEEPHHLVGGLVRNGHVKGPNVATQKPEVKYEMLMIFKFILNFHPDLLQQPEFSLAQ